jgi:hypothetical protein
MKDLKWFVIPDDESAEPPVECESLDHAMLVHAMLGDQWYLDGVDVTRQRVVITANIPGELRDCDFAMIPAYLEYLGLRP